MPARFFWRGRSYRIDSIERVWRSGLAEPVGQRLYRIRSAQRTFLLAHDRRLGRWAVVRSPWRMRISLALNSLATRLAT